MKKREIFKVEGDRIVRQRKPCPRCGDGVFLAEHKNRISCGTCGYTEFKGKPSKPAPLEQSTQPENTPPEKPAEKPVETPVQDKPETQEKPEETPVKDQPKDAEKPLESSDKKEEDIPKE